MHWRQHGRDSNPVSPRTLPPLPHSGPLRLSSPPTEARPRPAGTLPFFPGSPRPIFRQNPRDFFVEPNRRGRVTPSRARVPYRLWGIRGGVEGMARVLWRGVGCSASPGGGWRHPAGVGPGCSAARSRRGAMLTPCSWGTCSCWSPAPPWSPSPWGGWRAPGPGSRDALRRVSSRALTPRVMLSRDAPRQYALFPHTYAPQPSNSLAFLCQGGGSLLTFPCQTARFPP